MLVVVFAFNGVQLLDIVGPVDVLAAGAHQMGLLKSYRFVTASLDGNPVTASNGIRVAVDCSLAQIAGEIDTLLVPGCSDEPKLEDMHEIPRWLAEHAGSVRRIGAVCAGAFLLGHAGLLNGRKVTTHWKKAKQLASCFPRAIVQSDRIVLRDGQIYTSGGVTAGMDLALGLLEEDFGKELSMKVARQFLLLPKRERGQTQFTEIRYPLRREECVIEEVKRWLREHLDKPLTPEQLALQAGMSLMNFQEMFFQNTGMKPDEYIEDARIEMAQHMLETSDQPMSRVARACGFADTRELRKNFSHRVGMPPSLYRRQNKSSRRHH